MYSDCEIEKKRFLNGNIVYFRPDGDGMHIKAVTHQYIQRSISARFSHLGCAENRFCKHMLSKKEQRICDWACSFLSYSLYLSDQVQNKQIFIYFSFSRFMLFHSYPRRRFLVIFSIVPDATKCSLCVCMRMCVCMRVFCIYSAQHVLCDSHCAMYLLRGMLGLIFWMEHNGDWLLSPMTSLHSYEKCGSAWIKFKNCVYSLLLAVAIYIIPLYRTVFSFVCRWFSRFESFSLSLYFCQHFVFFIFSSDVPCFSYA